MSLLTECGGGATPEHSGNGQKTRLTHCRRDAVEEDRREGVGTAI